MALGVRHHDVDVRHERVLIDFPNLCAPLRERLVAHEGHRTANEVRGILKMGHRREGCLGEEALGGVDEVVVLVDAQGELVVEGSGLELLVVWVRRHNKGGSKAFQSRESLL